MAKHVPAELFRLEPAPEEGGSRKEQLYLTFNTEDSQEVKIPLQMITGIRPGPVLLILAAVHGDEYEGVQTVIELGNMLAPDDINGTLLLVPMVNMSAYKAGDRFSSEDGRNLAREFPGDPLGSITQRLAWHLGRSLIEQADFLLDFHSGGTYYEIPELVGFYDNPDNELGRRSRAAAEAFGMEVLWGHAELAAGRTISHAHDCGIPWLYTEAAGGRRVKSREQLHFRQGALRLMAHLGMLEEPQQWIDEAKPPIQYILTGNGNFDNSIIAENAGFFIPAVTLLQKVEAGELIGSTYDCFGKTQETFSAICSGYIVGLAGIPVVEPGAIIYMITQLKE